MTESPQQVLADTLDLLIGISCASLPPDQARAQLRQLQRNYPDQRFDLIWEEQSFDYSLHYDVMIRQLAGAGTVTLSYAPARVLPWPMRSLHRWREADLVQVNATVLKIGEAIAYLDYIWEDRRIIDRLVHLCLIQEALASDPITLTDEELQRAMDGFRRARKLYTAEETRRWMERQGVTHERLERYVADEALVARLRERAVGARVEPYFAANRAAFDRVTAACATFADAAQARHAAEQIGTWGADFYGVVEDQVLAAQDRGAQPPTLSFETIRRGAAEPGLAEAVFAAKPGEMVGPIETAAGHTLALVLSYAPARFDAATRRAIEQLLFEDWLEQRRAEATIEWFWGSTEPANPAS